MRRFVIAGFFACFLVLYSAQAQVEAVKSGDHTTVSKPAAVVQQKKVSKKVVKKRRKKVFYGTASYYSDKFRGRKTASGTAYRRRHNTAACNVLPLGTLVRVTNLKNKKSIVVKINDRMHRRSRRLVDLSRSCAVRLGFVKQGVTRVKVEVLGKRG